MTPMNEQQAGLYAHDEQQAGCYARDEKQAQFYAKIEALTKAFEGKVSFYIQKVGDPHSCKDENGCIRFEGGETPALAYRENVLCSIASTGKLFILGALLEQAENKLLSFGTTVTRDSLMEYLRQSRVYEAKDKVGGSGIIQYLTLGTRLTLYDLALLMVIVSDNTATNMLIDEVGGTAKVMEHLDRLGIEVSGVNRKIAGKAMEEAVQERVDSINEMPGHVRNAFSRATAKELVDYLVRVEKGGLAFAERSNEEKRDPGAEVFETILEKQQYKDMFTRYLPVADFFEEEGQYIRVFNKTGFDGPTRSDAGVLEVGKERYAYAIIINHGKDTSYRPEQDGAVLMGRIGEAFFESIQ